MEAKTGSLIGGTLLVAGTCIGAGMLALPVLTSLGGFIPSVVIYFICWLFMACTGLLLLEVCHWMEGETNIVSMAEKTLGTFGKGIAWSIYLFFFYTLTVAYIVGCGNLVAQVFPVSEWVGALMFVAAFSPFVITGAQFVGRLNVLLMVGLGLSFIAFVYMGSSFVKTEHLIERNWSLSLLALPVAFASFGYQGIIPTLTHYFQRDVKRVRLAILMGSFIPFVTYIVWQWLILGIVPTHGPGGLEEALVQGNNAVQPLKYFIDSSKVYVLGQYFAFFALTTSFFGVTLGLFDFLADGLDIKKDVPGKLSLFVLVFIPPLAVAYIKPHIFIQAIDFAGGFGAALLLGLFPVLMVWSGRYRMKLPSVVSVPGGRVLLSLLILFIVFEVVFEFYKIVFLK